jgi:hypothetical protein
MIEISNDYEIWHIYTQLDALQHFQIAQDLVMVEEVIFESPNFFGTTNKYKKKFCTFFDHYSLNN